MVKKVLKITGLAIVAIIFALFVAAFVFRDKIMNEFKKQITENINAKVDWKDFDISFLRSFPQLYIKMNDLSVIGIDTFENIPLFTSKVTELDFNILPFIKGNEKPSIKYFSIDGAMVNILVLNDSTANYLITKKSEDTTSFNLALDEYEIKNSKLFYTDNTLDVKVKALGLNHRGSGELGSTIYDLDTDSEVDSLSVTFEGFDYLKNVSATLKSLINVNMLEEKYTFKSADISLNKLLLNGNFSFQAKEGGWDIIGDIKNNGDSFRNILSVMPFIDQSKEVKADGLASINIKVNGYFHGEKELVPAFDIKAGIKNGSAQYSGLPYPLKNVQLDAQISSSHPKMKDLKVNVRQLDMSVNNEKIESKFTINDGLTDALLDGKLVASIRLENWSKALPLEGVEAISGSIQSNLTLNARQSAIENQKYEAIKFSGIFSGKDIKYKKKASPAISIGDFTFNASPSKMILTANNITAGKSDMDAGGELVNPLAYFSDVKNVTGTININARNVDLNEWITEGGTSDVSNANAVPMDLSAYKFNAVSTNINAEKVSYGTYQLKNFSLKGNFGLQNLKIDNFSTTIDQSDISINGLVTNIYDYLFENGTLTGNIFLKSNNFNANQFMSAESASSDDSLLFLVPENVILDIDANIKSLTYTNMILNNLNGKVAIKDQSISMYDCKASMLGGDVSLDGLYDTKSTKPLFNVKLNLNKIQFPKAFEQIVTIKQLAPVMKYIEGLFNTTLVMEGNLKKGMVPDLSTISASGLLETLNGAIRGLKPLNAASDKLGLSSLSPFSLKDTKNWFEIKNGNVELKEFTKELGDVGLRMKGNHKIQGPMNYEMVLKIPREKLKKSGLTSGLEKGWSFIEKEAAKKGVDVAQGEFLDVKINIGGMLSSPDLKFTLLGTSGKSMKEEIQEEVQKSIEQAKDSIKREANRKIEQAKDSLKRLGEKELEKAKQKAEEEANKVISDVKEKAKKEIETKIDTLINKTVSDSLKKKADEVLKAKTGKEVDDIKDKIKEWNPFKKKK